MYPLVFSYYLCRHCVLLISVWCREWVVEIAPVRILRFSQTHKLFSTLLILCCSYMYPLVFSYYLCRHCVLLLSVWCREWVVEIAPVRILRFSQTHKLFSTLLILCCSYMYPLVFSYYLCRHCVLLLSVWCREWVVEIAPVRISL